MDSLPLSQLAIDHGKSEELIDLFLTVPNGSGFPF
jgi:hypothetical protein